MKAKDKQKLDAIVRDIFSHGGPMLPSYTGATYTGYAGRTRPTKRKPLACLEAEQERLIKEWNKP